MKTFTVNRRQVLRGAGGFSLGLPFLPSLLPRRADGAEPVAGGRKFFAALMTQHGAVMEGSMYPAAASLTQTTQILAGHNVKSGALAATAAGANAALSAVLTGPASKLTPKLVSKMNVMRGFEIPFYIGHHTGGHLGNFVRSDQGPQNLKPWPTVDQVVGYSSKFYSDLAGVKLRTMVTGMDFHGASWNYSNPTAKTGSIQKVGVDGSPKSLWGKLFNGFMPPTAGPRRQPIIDRVLTNFNSLKQSNRRLSGSDRQRLDDHASRLAELQRRVGDVTIGCTEVKPVGDAPGGNMDSPSIAGRYFQLINDVITTAFSCGTSRIATVWIHTPFHDMYPASWHQDTAHRWEAADAQARLVVSNQRAFELVILDLAAKLDAIEDSPGASLLDKSLVQWTQESGWSTHDAQDLPIVTFGGAGGYFKTGQFVDFRNTGRASAHLDIFGRQKQFTGLWVRQWLATVAQSMGLAPADFEQDGKTGFGDAFWASAYDKAVHTDVINKASTPVPVVTA